MKRFRSFFWTQFCHASSPHYCSMVTRANSIPWHVDTSCFLCQLLSLSKVAWCSTPLEMRSSMLVQRSSNERYFICVPMCSCSFRFPDFVLPGMYGFSTNKPHNEAHVTEKKINATKEKVITVNERKDCLFALKKRFL